MVFIKGMFAAARSVFLTFLLLLIILYVFAIAFTTLLESTDVGDLYFTNVLRSMNTLWLYGTLLEEITTLMSAVEEEGVGVMLLLDLYVLFASLTVMNMLIGVLCEVVIAVAKVEKEELALNVMQKVLFISNALGIDVDHNGKISKEEFVAMVENKEAVRTLSELGVNVVHLVDMTDSFFHHEDHEADFGKELSLPDFMEVVMQFRGQNQATVKDIMQLRKFIRTELNKSDRLAVEASNNLEETIVDELKTELKTELGASFMRPLNWSRKNGDRGRLTKIRRRGTWISRFFAI